MTNKKRIGRPPGATAPPQPLSMRLTAADAQLYRELGGVRWLRAQLEVARATLQLRTTKIT